MGDEPPRIIHLTFGSIPGVPPSPASHRDPGLTLLCLSSTLYWHCAERYSYPLALSTTKAALPVETTALPPEVLYGGHSCTFLQAIPSLAYADSIMSQPPTSTWSRVFSAGVVPNTGSAARDHLAGERTVLAWLRTSMVLATIGISASLAPGVQCGHPASGELTLALVICAALAQLLRLPSTAFGTSSVPVTTASSSSISKRNEMSANVTAALEALVASDPGLEPLVHLLAAQQAQLDSHRLATLSSGAAESPYAHLAAPLGGTFLMLSLVFLLLGAFRCAIFSRARIAGELTLLPRLTDCRNTKILRRPARTVEGTEPVPSESSEHRLCDLFNRCGTLTR